MISAIGKSGVRSSGPTGFSVPGCSTGGGGAGRSAMMLYQCLGIRVSSSRYLTLSLMRSSRLSGSVRQRVEHDVDAQGVAARRKEIEELVVIAFALPAVGDVSVVRDDDHQVARLVPDALEEHRRAVAA